MDHSVGSSGLRGHMIVCGDNALAQRITSELAGVYGQHVTVILPSLRGGTRGPQIAELLRHRRMSVEAVEAQVPDDEALLRAGVKQASALALTTGDDQFNIYAALRARRLNPSLRLVIRMFNRTLGDYLEQLLDRAGEGTDTSPGRAAGQDATTTVLSDAETAAPGLVAAAVVGQEKVLSADRLLLRAKERTLRSADRRNPLATLALLPADANDDEGSPAEERQAEEEMAAAAGPDSPPTGDATVDWNDQSQTRVDAMAWSDDTVVEEWRTGQTRAEGATRAGQPHRRHAMARGARHVLLPSAEDLAGLPPDRRAVVLEAISRPRSATDSRPSRFPRLLTFKQLFSRRLRYTAVTVLAALLILATLNWLAARGDSSWWQAGYTTLLDVLAINNPDTDHGFSFTQRVLQLSAAIVGMALLPLFLAVVLESYGAFRKAASLPDPPRRISGHVVLLGLGKIGTRVLDQLLELDIPVVCIERDPEARGIALARRHRVPTLIADVTQEGVLNEAKIRRSRALLALTSDDSINLQASLYARQIKPQLRVVMRLFDDSFASTVYSTLRAAHRHAQTRSRSVSALAAPAFAGAMMGRQILGAVPVGRRVLVFASLNVRGNRLLEGRTVAQAFRTEAWRVIALDVAQEQDRVADLSSLTSPLRREKELEWKLEPGYVLRPQDRVVVAATKRGLSRLLEASPDSSTPPIPGTGEHRVPPQEPVAPRSDQQPEPRPEQRTDPRNALRGDRP